MPSRFGIWTLLTACWKVMQRDDVQGYPHYRLAGGRPHEALAHLGGLQYVPVTTAQLEECVVKLRGQVRRLKIEGHHADAGSPAKQRVHIGGIGPQPEREAAHVAHDGVALH
mmetsp:Transcript_53193/g.146927  ORF Transcript_53193/g.146927 Transcript_53193/m.146927 type:complete len:112 (-) Transcript_53193:449-784(-)|eukprot:3740869-Prymnesium_polylepis.1